MKDRIKSYSFWVSLSGSLVVLIEAIGRAVGFIPNGVLINDIVMGVAGILVVLGVVTMPNSDGNNTGIEKTEDKEDENSSKEN